MNTTQQVALSLIDIPESFRQHQMESVDALAQDIQRNGQIQEIVVTPKEGGRYELVAGKRRTLALRHLNWENVRAQVMENLSELQKALIMIAENDEREDVNPFDRALSYQRALKVAPSQKDLAVQLGISEDKLSKILSVLAFSPEITEELRRRNFSGAHLTELIRLPDTQSQLKMVNACDKAGWSSKLLRDKVSRELTGGSKDSRKEAPAEPALDPKPIRFTWKDGKLAVKIQPLDPDNLMGFLSDIEMEWKRFVDLHPRPAVKTSAPEGGVMVQQAA